MKRHGEGGQTLVFVALGMVMLGAILGLAVDIGYMRFLKRRLQTAADSAAIAGAAEVKYGDVTAAAKADAASNGFTDGSSGVTVTVNNAPVSGPNQGKQGYVEVLISKSQPTFFIRIVPGGATNSTVQARAVAYLGSAKGCIYSLQPSPGAITIETSGLFGGSAASVTAQNCAIIDNGDLTITGGTGSVSASAIGVGGTVFSSGSTVTPSPQPGMISASDPLSYLSAPSAPDCNGGGKQTISGGFANVDPGACTIVIGGKPCTGSPTVTFSPGTYGSVSICGASTASFGSGNYSFSSLTISNSATVTFNPGVYAFSDTGGLSINSSGTVTGTGVTFYSKDSTAVSITSTGTVSLAAPTTGPYAGILLFQDGNDNLGATVNGGNNSKFEGAFYLRNVSAQLTMGNIGSAAAYTIVVAGSLTIGGNSNTFNSNYSSLANGSPIKDAVLVE
jgi:hypothetical protein